MRLNKNFVSEISLVQGNKKLTVPPTTDDLVVEMFSLPDDAQILTDDGQSPFSAFFSTGWFEKRPAIPEYIEFETEVRTTAAIYHSTELKLSTCEEQIINNLNHYNLISMSKNNI